MADVAAALADLARRDLPSMLDDLRRLIELETPSNDKALLDAGLSGIESWLTERLGWPDARHRHDGGGNGDVLELDYLPDNGGSGSTVVLLCHYDTVWPAGTVAEWPVTVEGDRLSGPGCLDMKAGLVHGVWALRLLRELGLARPGVRLLLTGDEEIGSHASRAHIERVSAEAAATLVLEPSKDGHVKTGRKGMGLFSVTAHGIESHAGLDPLAGASAIHALAEVIPAITALARPDLGTTVNVGVVSGGTGRNVVAGRANCLVDIRVQDPAEMGRIDTGLAELAPTDTRVKLVVGGEWNRPPMNPNPPSRRLLSQARAVAAELGVELDELFVGGASDANFVSALGRPVLDGLGAVGAGPHARDEHILTSATPTQVALVAGLLTRLAHTGSARTPH